MNDTAVLEELNSPEQWGDLFSKLPKFPLTIALILLIIVIILNCRVIKKRKIKNKYRLQNEINDYLSIGQKQTYRYSGNVAITSSGISYSRGNKRILFDIPISDETVLNYGMIQKWFENRNYNAREADYILEDIRHFLIENKYCTSAIIDNS